MKNQSKEKRRRLTRAIVSNRTEAVGLRELAAMVAARESRHDGEGEPPVTDVAVSFHHVHLPMLAEAGALEYEPDSHRITPRDVLKIA